MRKLRHPDRLGIHLRVVLGEEVAIGPGKADLLQGVAETGSIAAAGRRLGMSYKRAWSLVEAMNAMFAEPLVEAAKGGAGGGGAALSPLGSAMLAAYRKLEAAAETAGAAELDAMRAAMRAPLRAPLGVPLGAPLAAGRGARPTRGRSGAADE